MFMCNCEVCTPHTSKVTFDSTHQMCYYTVIQADCLFYSYSIGCRWLPKSCSHLP